MSAALPLFPLGTVLFPGLLLPLHVFEPRYRALVNDLMALPDDIAREFGVVAIRRGWEVARAAPGAAGELIVEESPALYEVGCVAEVRQITEQEGGRFDVVVVGRRRFRVLELDPGAAPYLTARVEWLSEPAGEPGQARELASYVLAAFQRYLRLIRPDTDTADEIGAQLRDNPTVLSHLVGATASLTVDDRQQLLAAPDTVTRLAAERELLHREAGLLARVRAVPVSLSEMSVPTSLN